MGFSRKFICRDDLAQIVLLVILEYLLNYHLDGEIIIIFRDIFQILRRIFWQSVLRNGDAKLFEWEI